MDELEANCARIVPLLEIEGDSNRLLESLYKNWLLVTADGLITDASDEEPNLQVRIEEAHKVVAKIGQDKLELTNQIAKKEADWSCTMYRLKNMRRHEKILGNCLTVKRDKMSILKLYLLHCSNKAHRGKPIKPCLSVEEIAKHKSHFRVVHGTKTLAEEQKLLKEIKLSQKAGVGPFSLLEEEDLSRPYYVRFNNFYKHQTWLHVSMPLGEKEGIIAQDRLREVRELERRRDRVGLLLKRQRDGAATNAKTESVDYAFVEGKTWNAMGSEKSLRDQIKITGEEIDRFTKIQSAVWPKIKHIEAELKVIEKHLEPLKKKLALMAKRKNEAHLCLSKLIKQQHDVVQ